MSKPVNRLAASSQQTREHLLDAGLTLLLELPASTSFGHLTATKIATKAGRTSGAFFHHWPTLEAYMGDLVAHVLRPEQSVNMLRTVDRLLGDMAQGSTFAQALTEAGKNVPRQTAEDPQTVLELLMCNRALHDEDFRRDVARHYDALDEGAARVIEALTAVLGREIRPPFTPAVISAAISALAEGLSLRASLTPGFYPDKIFGWMVLSLIPLFTRDIADERDADGYVGELPLEADLSRLPPPPE